MTLVARLSSLAALAGVLAVLVSGRGGDLADARSPSVDEATGGPSEPALPPVPDSYRYVITSSCGERGFLGDYRVDVRDGAVVAVESLDEDHPYEPQRREVPTLTDLRAMAGSAAPGSVVDYRLDENGYPQHLSLDPVPHGIDDEECYTVTDLDLDGP